MSKVTFNDRSIKLALAVGIPIVPEWEKAYYDFFHSLAGDDTSHLQWFVRKGAKLHWSGSKPVFICDGDAALPVLGVTGANWMDVAATAPLVARTGHLIGINFVSVMTEAELWDYYEVIHWQDLDEILAGGES